MDKISNLGEVPAVAMDYVKWKFCKYNEGLVVPKNLKDCEDYKRCIKCGGCLYEK